MKKIKKKAMIIAGTVGAGLLGLFGINNYYNDIEPQCVYGVPDDYVMPVQTFNSQFTSYEGNKRSSSQVKALINVIKSSNAVNDRQIIYVGPENSEIFQGEKYSITLEYDEEGYVCRAIVEEYSKDNKTIKNNEIL